MRDTSYEILDAVISSKIHFETVKLFICHESRIPHLVSRISYPHLSRKSS